MFLLSLILRLPDITAGVPDLVDRLMGTEHGTTAPSMEIILGTQISQRQEFIAHNHTQTANAWKDGDYITAETNGVPTHLNILKELIQIESHYRKILSH